MVVPGALVDDPAIVPLQALPVVEAADLSAFGESADTLVRDGALTVVAPVGLARNDRNRLARVALTRLARACGLRRCRRIGSRSDGVTRATIRGRKSNVTY
jgi:hypothetical protein